MFCLFGADRFVLVFVDVIFKFIVIHSILVDVMVVNVKGINNTGDVPCKLAQMVVEAWWQTSLMHWFCLKCVCTQSAETETWYYADADFTGIFACETSKFNLRDITAAFIWTELVTEWDVAWAAADCHSWSYQWLAWAPYGLGAVPPCRSYPSGVDVCGRKDKWMIHMVGNT